MRDVATLGVCLTVGAASTACGPSLSTTAQAHAATQAAIGASALTLAPLERVSVANGGAELRTCTTARPACKNSSHPVLSYDGLRVAFDCDALDVVPGFANDRHDAHIYVRDLASGSTQLISAARAADGSIVPPNDGAAFAEMSADGAFVAFGSSATNLAAPDTEPDSDVFLARLEPFQIECLTATLDGVSSGPALNADARFVAFVSTASVVPDLRLVDGRPASQAPATFDNVFLLDRSNARFTWLSAARDKQSNGPSTQPSVDDVGLRIAFVSEATDLVERDSNGAEPDVFVIDRESGELRCVSVALGSRATANGVSRKPAISGNGRFVVFESTATDLIAPGSDTNKLSDIFVRDLATESTVRVSVANDDAEARGQSGYGAISPDGRFVAFTSFARNLVPGGTTRGTSQFYVRDRDVSGNGVFDEAGDTRTLRLSQSLAGIPANARSGGNCDLSGDGRTAVFMSEGSELVPGDLNGAADHAPCSPTCLFGRDVFRVTFD
ncbi:MAG: PD40 domain-containing protein [Planctomycetes bacterium]|nr:PD40 domain-containing protein [Planctomycetota bacterium]